MFDQIAKIKIVEREKLYKIKLINKKCKKIGKNFVTKL